MPDTIGWLTQALEQMTGLLEQVPVDRLDAPTPCEDWTVRELLRYVVRQDLGNFVVGARGDAVDWAATPSPLGETWLEDYHRGAHELLLVWQSADLEREVPSPGGGRAPLATRADQQTAELSVHAWDLARAVGLPASLDEGVAEHALAWSRGMLQPQFRGPGRAFGPEVPVPADAPVVDRLVGWFGRDPGWRAPAVAG